MSSHALPPPAIRHHLLVVAVAVSEADIDSTAGVLGHVHHLLTDSPLIAQAAVIAQLAGREVTCFQDGHGHSDLIKPPVNPRPAPALRLRSVRALGLAADTEPEAPHG